MPSRKDGAAELAEKVFRVLESQRRLGDESYPLTVERLAELAELRLADAHFKSIVGGRSKISRERIVVAAQKRPDAPVAFVEDIGRLAACSLLVQFALRAARSDKAHAFTVAQLKSKLTSKLREPFQKAVTRKIREKSLPETVGWLKFGNSCKLFLVEDLLLVENIQPESLRKRLQRLYPKFAIASTPAGRANAGQGARAPATSKSEATIEPCEFAERFEEAFERLDRQLGSNNHVPLVDLRRSLAEFSRQQFDQGLRELRLAGRYSLSGHEGRYGISDESRRAAILEGGMALYFVSRRSS